MIEVMFGLKLDIFVRDFESGKFDYFPKLNFFFKFLKKLIIISPVNL